MHEQDSPGFSLLEVLFATTILTVAVMSLAQVVAMTTRANAMARRSALESLLAAQKMEQLRALEWGFDASGSGAAVSDLTTAQFGLTSSPPGTLNRDVDGYVDWLDGDGSPVLRVTAAAFVRRWSIAALPANADTIVLQVTVGAIGSPASSQAHLVTVKTRKGH